MAKANSKGMLPNGRKAGSGSYIKYLHVICDHPEFIALKSGEKELLLYVMRQYNGHNNGDMTLAPSVLKKWGLAKRTIDRNKRALFEYGWIVKTGSVYRGGKPTYLYGLTWLPMDECKGKLDDYAYKLQPRSLKPDSEHKGQIDPFTGVPH